MSPLPPSPPLLRSELIGSASLETAAPSRRPAAAPARTKRQFTRRAPDETQFLRRTVQAAFLLVNVWVGARFYLFVRYYETAGQTVFVPRPPGVEGWLPIAALMNLKHSVLTATFPDAHAAGMFLLLAFLGMSILARKSFCGWLCPIGTVSEWLWQGGEAMFGRALRVPRWLDIPLRSLKYVLLALFLYAVGSMSAGAIRAFLDSPYGVIADVKMLNFFRSLGTTAGVVIGALLVLSLPIKNVWCRYLCPYGALMGLVALASPVRIQRAPDVCIDCSKCATACPSNLPVDRLVAVRSAECTACMLCVSACPAAGALDLTVTGRRSVPAWMLAAAIALIFVGTVGFARVTGRWHTRVPDAVYFELIPRAGEFGHP